MEWNLKEIKENSYLRQLFIDFLKRNIYGTKVIKQRKNCLDCLPSVIAMITNKVADKVAFKHFIYKTTGNDGSEGYKELDAFKFLLTKGYVVGAGFIDPQQSLSEDGTEIIAKVPTKQIAILIVKNKQQKGGEKNNASTNHAVFWDGSAIHDPDFNVNGPQNLEDYQILTWWPIYNLQDSKFNKILKTNTL